MTGDSQRIQLQWNDLPASLRALFDIWENGGGALWGRATWARLAAKGVNTANGRYALAEVRLRALALAVYYQSFCMMAWGETPPCLWESAQDAELSFNDVVALTGTEDVEEESALGDSDLYVEMLGPLLEEAYGQVSAALVKLIPNDILRFSYLWLSQERARAGALDLTSAELNEVLNAESDGKGTAYEWLVDWRGNAGGIGVCVRLLGRP